MDGNIYSRYVNYEHPGASIRVAKVFNSGNSQAVRLPKEFQFDVSEVEIFRDGNDVVLRRPRNCLSSVVDLLRELPADFPESIDDLALPARARL